MVNRGDVWLVALDPTVGSEIKKSRPCVVVSPPELNEHLRTVIVAPMTTQGFHSAFRISVLHAGKKGQIVLDQIRAVDKRRLLKCVGSVNRKTLSAVLVTLQELFAE